MQRAQAVEQCLSQYTDCLAKLNKAIAEFNDPLDPTAENLDLTTLAQNVDLVAFRSLYESIATINQKIETAQRLSIAAPLDKKHLEKLEKDSTDQALKTLAEGIAEFTEKHLQNSYKSSPDKAKKEIDEFQVTMLKLDPNSGKQTPSAQLAQANFTKLKNQHEVLVNDSITDQALKTLAENIAEFTKKHLEDSYKKDPKEAKEKIDEFQVTILKLNPNSNKQTPSAQLAQANFTKLKNQYDNLVVKPFTVSCDSEVSESEEIEDQTEFTVSSESFNQLKEQLEYFQNLLSQLPQDETNEDYKILFNEIAAINDNIREIKNLANSVEPFSEKPLVILEQTLKPQPSAPAFQEFLGEQASLDNAFKTIEKGDFDNFNTQFLTLNRLSEGVVAGRIKYHLYFQHLRSRPQVYKDLNYGADALYGNNKIVKASNEEIKEAVHRARIEIVLSNLLNAIERDTFEKAKTYLSIFEQIDKNKYNSLKGELWNLCHKDEESKNLSHPDFGGKAFANEDYCSAAKRLKKQAIENLIKTLVREWSVGQTPAEFKKYS